MDDVFETPDAASLLVSLSRNIPGAIYRCALDPNWTMHLIGQEIERITGYPADEFVANRCRTYASLIHEDDRDRVQRDVRDAVDAGRPFELEYRVRTASGDERWVLERGCAVAGVDHDWLDGIIFDITERRRFELTARRAEAEAAVAAELAESRRRIVAAADEARRRIERDLHDGAQQSFVCSLMTLRSACKHMADDPGGAAALLRATEEHLERGLSDLRELAQGIHPPVLATRGVAAAVGMLAARAPVPVRVVAELEERLPRDLEAALYFSAAEGLTNAAKHARATEIAIHVGRENGHAFVEIVDDGVGGVELGAGSGLSGMRDRLATVAGALEITSPPGAGTRLLARVPVPAQA